MALILSLTMFAKNMNGLLPRIGDFFSHPIIDWS